MEGCASGALMCELSPCLHRYEDYVDQCYKQFLKSQGKVDSVRLAEAAGGKHREAQRLFPSSSLV